MSKLPEGFNRYKVTLPNGKEWQVGALNEADAALTFESNYLEGCPNIGECKVELIEE